MVTAVIPPEIQAILDMNDPKCQEYFIKGYMAAKYEMRKALREMRPVKESSSTVVVKKRKK